MKNIETFVGDEMRDLPNKELDFSQIIWIQIAKIAYYASMDYEGKGRWEHYTIGAGQNIIHSKKWIDDPRNNFYNATKILYSMIRAYKQDKLGFPMPSRNQALKNYEITWKIFSKLVYLARKELDPKQINTMEII